MIKNFIHNTRYYLYKWFLPSKLIQLSAEFLSEKGKYLDNASMDIFDNINPDLPLEIRKYNYYNFYIKSIGFPKYDSLLHLDYNNSFYISIYAHDKLYDFEIYDKYKDKWYKAKSELILIDNEHKSYIDDGNNFLYRNFIYKITMNSEEFVSMSLEAINYDPVLCRMSIRAKIIDDDICQAAMNIVAFLDINNKLMAEKR